MATDNYLPEWDECCQAYLKVQASKIPFHSTLKHIELSWYEKGLNTRIYLRLDLCSDLAERVSQSSGIDIHLWRMLLNVLECNASVALMAALEFNDGS